MTQARQVVNETASAINRASSAIRGALAGAFVVTAIIEASRALIETQRAFDKLNASLVTATGSAANAKQAFGALQAFAATTPFGLQEVTEGFIKLRNMGMTPSERALNSYGNTASAMSKSLNQMIEAVADAASGEFERLKEFGIKAKQNGDQVSLTFQGVTTTIGNNAADIEKYLIGLGETKFGGGMALQAATLDGAISNLGDTWEATKRKFSEGGFGDLAQSATMALTGALTDLGAILDVVSGKAEEEGKAVKEASLLHTALTTVFETVSVLGLNVAYVFGQVGREMGGLAAQAAAVATGDFALAKQIGAQMRADAVAARAEVDAKSEAILQASSKARKAAEEEAAAKKAAGRDDLAQFGVREQAAKRYLDELARLEAAWNSGKLGQQAYIEQVSKLATETWKSSEAGQASAETLKKQAEAAKKAAQEYQSAVKAAGDFAARLAAEREEVGLSAEQVKMLNAARAAAKAPTEELRRKIMEEALALHVATQAWTEKTEAEKAAEAATVQSDEALHSATGAVWDQVAAMEKQVELFGLAEDQVLKLQRARLEADLAAADGDEKKIAALNLQIQGMTRLIDLAGQKKFLEESKQAAEEASRVQKAFWESIDKTAHDTFVSIMDGSKSAAQRLKETFKNVFFDWLYSMTLKPWIVNLQGQFSPGSVAGLSQTAGGAASALSSGVSLAQTASNLYSAFTGGMTLAGGVGTGFVGSVAGGLMGAGAGSGLTSSLGMAIGEGILNVVGPGVASALSSGIGAIATALPWVGGALAVLGLAKAAFGRGPKEVTGTTLTGTLGADGFDGKYLDAWTQKGGWFRSDKSGTTPRDVDAAMATGLSDAYAKITAASRDYAKALGIDADFITGRSQSLSIALTKDAAANEKAITDFFAGVANTIAGELVPDLSRFIKEGEVASSTLQRLAVQYTAVDAVLKAMGTTGEQAFGAVGVASLAAREQLLTLTGGLDAFASQSSFFSQNFLTEAERLKPVQDQVTAKMAELGFAGVTTVDAFKNVVVGLQTSGALAHEVGATAYAELLKIAPAFKVVADAQAAAAKAQAEATQKAADDAAAVAQRLADINKPYLDRIAELETALGYAVTVRDAETAAVDASTQAAMDRVAVLEKEVAARDAQAKQIADFMANNYGQNVVQIEQQQQAAVEASVTKRANLEIQLYNLTHTAAEQLAATRERELSAAAPLEQALLKQIYAQQDLADAATAAAKQIEDAAARARAVAQERAGIERSILQLQGNTAELRKLELAALDPANREKQEELYRLQDRMAAEAAAAAQAQAMAEAQARAAQAQAQAAADAKRAEEALMQARQSATDAMFGEINRLRGLIDSSGVTSLADARAAFAIANAQARAGDLEAMKALPALSKTLDDLVAASAVTAFDLRLARAQAAASLAQTGDMWRGQYGVSVPAFASGGDHMGGLRIVGENGPELEATGPARIFNASQTANMIGSSSAELVAEVRALRAENRDMAKRLDDALYAIAKNTLNAADTLDTWDRNGIPEERESA